MIDHTMPSIHPCLSCFFLDVLETDDNSSEAITNISMPESFCLETALLLMECSWQAYYVTPAPKKQTSTSQSGHKVSTRQGLAETQPLLNRESSSTPSDGEGSYFSGLMGSDIIPQMDVAQYGLRVVKGFSNLEGDISGYVATDNCKLYGHDVVL